MKLLGCIAFIFFMGCTYENKEDVIRREITLKEARKGHKVVALKILNEKAFEDTSEIYYHASVKIQSRDSIIEDSLFLIKGANGVLLPFSTKIP